MDSIAINIPFILLSICINWLGETEKRILTPFGIIDVIFKPTLKGDGLKAHFEIEVAGDTETRLLYNQAFDEFEKTAHDFLREIAQKHLVENVTGDFQDVSIHIKGFETHLRVPCEEYAVAQNTSNARRR